MGIAEEGLESDDEIGVGGAEGSMATLMSWKARLKCHTPTHDGGSFKLETWR